MTTQMIRWFLNNKLLLIFGVATFCFAVSTDAESTESYRLSKSIIPKNYTLKLTPNLENKTYDGEVTFSLLLLESTKIISLNSRDIDIKTVTVSSTSNINISVVSTNLATKTEILQINLKDEITPNTTCDLYITFAGILDRNDGLYESTLSNGDIFLATAFKPISARSAFPNFDEPGFKAPIKIIINKPKNYLALSNTQVESNTTDSASNTDVVTFSNTLPLSSYQVSVVLCNFDSKKTEITTNGAGNKFDLTIYAQKSQISNVLFSQDIATRAFKSIVEYFNRPYPLSKLDLIAIPDYKDELNAQLGLTSIRESLLTLDTATASSNNKKTNALTLTRGLSSTFMDNVVTTSWWSDQWLYEGSTLWFSYIFLNDVEPTWTMLDQFPTRTMHSALNIDATLSSHPLVQTLETPDKIPTTVDSISSGKGASIIRMMEAFIGKNNFRDGVRDYVKNYEYGNAGTAEFLSCLESYFKKNNSAVNATLSDIMSTWIYETGYPLITVKAVENNTYELTQTRFLQTSTNEKSNSSWYIPITYKTNKGVNKNTVWLSNTEPSIKITLDKSSRWLKLNNNQKGYFRVEYAKELLQNLIEALKNTSEQLTNTDRVNLINDYFALAKTKGRSYVPALNLTTYLTKEKDPESWQAFSPELSDLFYKLLNTTASDNLKKYCKYLVNNFYKSISWEKNNSTVIEGSKRARALNIALECGVSDAEKLVRKLFAPYLNSTKNQVDQSIRFYVYTYAMKSATQEQWDTVWQRYLNETDAQEKFKLRAALCAPSNIVILQRCLELVKDEKNVPGQDFLSFLTFLSSNPVAVDLVWNYTRTNWTQLVERYTIQSTTLGTLIQTITSTFNTETRLKEMNDFFTQYPEAGVGATSRASALETVKYNIQWETDNMSDVCDWLDAIVKSLNL